MRKKQWVALLLAVALLLSACGAQKASITEALQQRREELQSAEEPPPEETEPDSPAEEQPEEKTVEEPQEAIPEEVPEADTETKPEEETTAKPEEKGDAEPGEETDAASEPEEPEERDLTVGRENLIPFDEMEYVRPELAVLEEKIAVTMELAAEGSDPDAVIDALMECDALYYTYYTMYVLAEIRYYQDMTSEYWSEEYTVCDEVSLEMEIL